MMKYVGRFAPSPTGPLHAGSLVTALAGYLDAKVHQGQWFLRIDDVDEIRTVPGAAEAIIAVLMRLGMRWDGEVIWQSRCKSLYEKAAASLVEFAYPCRCTRREIADSRIGIASDGAAIYPGTCRHDLVPGRIARALRVRVPEPSAPAAVIRLDDRWEGMVTFNLAIESGDFVLKRADGFWAYQLAVVVDDAEQGITHVVRGADLLYSTPRQMYLQKLLDYPTPQYLHVPVLRNQNGDKLSKQNGAMPIEISARDDRAALSVLLTAAQFLGLSLHQAQSVEHFWRIAVPAWRNFLECRTR